MIFRRLVSLAGLFASIGWTTAAIAAESWRFCLTMTPDHHALVTELFQSDQDSMALEKEIAAAYARHRGVTLTFQCPLGDAEKVKVLNAQTETLAFNRRFGAMPTLIPLSEVDRAKGR